MKLRKILKVKALPDFMLSVIFENGVEKTVDFKPYFKFPVFEVLKTVHAFSGVRNSGYFIEWPGYEIDLSADTLWNDGESVEKEAIGVSG